MALPFLPGNSFNKNLGKTKYHKSHHFDISNDVSMLVGEAKPGIGGERLPFQKLPPPNSYIPRGQGTDLPSWVAFDKQVLSFDAFYQEPVHEKREEQYRVHSCKIYFYLEDDSIQVVEPRAKNAGLPQGTIIRRHRIARPPPCDDTFYTVEDFNVGKELVFYGKTFKITDLDPFTRNFLTKLGVRLQNPSSVPNDPYMTHRKALDESMQPLRPYEKMDTLKQFIDHDRHVLRFYCYWDDKENMFGDSRYMVLHYFLADDTIEILERVPANSGRDAVPMFLRRGRMPKIVASMLKPGEKTDRTVLNVFGPMQQGGRYILDSLKTGEVHQEYYKDSDLSIGAVLNMWGRKVVLCDCDEFTREYYKTKYGVTEMTPIPYKEGGRAPRVKEVPPYNGFGSEEDSLCSCQGLMPSPPRRDFIKFMEKDRRGLESNVLRFLGRMVTAKPIDQSRRFIISYFLSDDTILVFEPPVRNSGIIGGKFLERGRIKKPGQERYRVELSEYYTARDLFVGGRIDINNFIFELIDADEYCYRYMENHCTEFPMSDIGRVMEKLAGGIGDVSKAESLQQFCDFRRFAEIVSEKAPRALNEQELRTVARFYQDRRNETLSTETMQAIVQDHLRRANFEQFIPFHDQCMHHDSSRCGRITPTMIKTVAQALHVQVPSDLLRGFIGRLVGEDGLVDYTDFVQRLNWRDAAVEPPSVPIELASEWRGTTPSAALDVINFGQLIKDLGGPAPLTEDEKVNRDN